MKNKVESIQTNRVLIGGDDVLAAEMNKIPEEEFEDPEGQKKVLERYLNFLKELRIRFGTLLKTDNVSFLIGAGCSMEAGGVSLATIPFEVERYLLEKGITKTSSEKWMALFYNLLEGLVDGVELTPKKRRRQVNKIASKLNDSDHEEEEAKGLITDFIIRHNLEEFLSQLFTWRAALVGDRITLELEDSSEIEIVDEELDELIARLTEGLARACLLPHDGKESALQVHRQMIRKVLTRPLNLRRVNLYTLNYDTLLEQAADAEGVVLMDGFVGGLRRIFRPESFDQDLYFPAQTTEGRVHRLDRVIHLYKLHGSVTWHRTEPEWENPYGLYATFLDQGDYAENVLIFPTPLKYGQSLGFPYSELFRRFQAGVVQAQSVLFVIGYGFGDEHVNALIRQALAIPSFTLVVVSPDPQSTFVKELEERCDKRVWVVKGWGDASNRISWGLGTFKGFVEHLLPDLRDEEILAEVMKTYKMLAPTSPE